MKYDVAVIGGGPAGLSAALYAARGGLNVALIEKGGIGGQASLTAEIENYPGFDKISGFELTMQMQNQAEHFGAEFIYDDVIKMELKGSVKRIFLSNSTVETKSVILCMGASARKLGIKNEKELIGNGISYCATCDGAFFKGKAVAVNGGGNTAVMDALYLERFAKEVYLIHRRQELRATSVLKDRLKESGVKVLWDSVVTELNGEKKLESLTVQNVKTNEISTVAVNGLFVAIGQIPASELAVEVEKDESGYIVTNEDMETNIDGVFAAGDIRQKTLRQVVTACADGAIAAESASCYLSSNKHCNK